MLLRLGLRRGLPSRQLRRTLCLSLKGSDLPDGSAIDSLHAGCAGHAVPELAAESPVTRNIDHLIECNKVWAEENKDWLNKHGGQHRPRYLWIGCSDARVPANEIIGQPSGNVFVHRNVANLVVPSDANFGSVLQYAVNVLRVPHIIVCGHYDCGGIKAAMSRITHDSRDLGSPLQDWLNNIRDVCRLHEHDLDAISDPDVKHRRLVELNVIEQCLNIFKTGVVQRRRLLTSKVPGAFPQPRVHGVVYNPKDGKLVKLDNDFRKERARFGKIYDIFED
ncbi:hypothetical protein AB1Y20_018854 [Prymnesium parvum]|uniref:Carbonic anhydrase n=1 Tax=Prymnesium parvum TaxID=97485 RepID=A0AB34JPN4_PRYPA